MYLARENGGMMLEILLAAAAAAPLAQPACPIDRQVYRLQADARFTAGFAPLDKRLARASDLHFWLRTPKRTYWFSFRAPNGYGGTIIMPDVSPAEAAKTLRDDAPPPPEPDDEGEPVAIEFDAFRPDLSVYPGPPQSSDPAPVRLFARGLGPSLWYEPDALAGGEAAEQEAMPIAMFEPGECARR